MFCGNCGKEIQPHSKFCHSCGSEIKTKQSEDTATKAESLKAPDQPQVNTGALELFYVSPWQLFWLNFFTCGLYQLYWFTQNWIAIEKHDKKKIWPFARAIFAVFFCYELFARILKEAKSKGYYDSYSPGFLTFLFIAFLVIGKIVGSDDVEAPVLVWFLVFAADVIPLWIAQKASNYYISKTSKKHLEKKQFYTGEVVLIIIGVILFILAWIGILAE